MRYYHIGKKLGQSEIQMQKVLIYSLISNPGDMFSNCETNFDYDFK